MAIDPSKSVPDDAASVSSLQSMTEESAKAAMRAPVDQAWGNARGSLVGNILGGIANAIRGVFSPGSIFAPIGDAIKPIRDGQLDLEHRTDLLEGVQGYAYAYMSKNINAQWSFSDNWRFLPFDGQLGPAVGARVRSDGRVEMGSAGLWTVYAKIHGRGTSFSGDTSITMRVRVFRPNGNFHSESYVRGTTIGDTGPLNTTFTRPGSLVNVFPVVVPGPGYYVRVDAWTAAWRWWDGGTQLSMLAVLKQSNNVENQGDQTVPDEKESEAGE